MKKEFIKSKLMVYQLKALNFQEVNREFMEVEIQNSKWVGFFKMSISRKIYIKKKKSRSTYIKILSLDWNNVINTQQMLSSLGQFEEILLTFMFHYFHYYYQTRLVLWYLAYLNGI